MTVAETMLYVANFKYVCESRRHILYIINFDFINEGLIKKVIFWHAVGASIKVWQNQLLFSASVMKTGFLFEFCDKDVKVLFWVCSLKALF